MSAPRANPRLAKTLADPDTKSRQKAKYSHERSKQVMENVTDAESWPRNSNGRPMMKISMTASELIPHGQYANVSVGPAQITAFIDPEREIEVDGVYFTEKERETMACALNELAEVVEYDVISVQRNSVLESLQEQKES